MQFRYSILKLHKRYVDLPCQGSFSLQSYHYAFPFSLRSSPFGLQPPISILNSPTLPYTFPVNQLSWLTTSAEGLTMYANVLQEVSMLKAASVTVRVKPSTKTRLEALANATKRSKSYVIEEALEQYLDVNEWQIEGIAKAIAEADRPDADFVDHDEVLAKWEKKIAD
jgi:RHH-type rel operon transcriptional repressor/antitoxin RelB